MAQSPSAAATHDLLRLVSRKYVLQIIALLDAEGPLRYSEIEARVDASSTSTFADHMADLVDSGLVKRHWYDEMPPRVEYTLTARGQDLITRMEPLREWAVEE